MTRPRPFFQNSFRSFKKFTYQALTEHQEQMTNCDNSNSTIKDLDFLKFPQIINDEKLNELELQILFNTLKQMISKNNKNKIIK